MKKTLRRKWLWLLPLLLFALAFKAPKDVTITMNGEIVSTDQPPVIKNSRTFVPVRVIAENLGAQVFYLSNERAVSIEKGDMHIYIPIGKKEMWISTAELAGPVPLDAPAFIKNNRTMLPLRTIAEMFDMDVEWDGHGRVVHITSPDHYLKSYVNDGNAVEEVLSRLRKKAPWTTATTPRTGGRSLRTSTVRKFRAFSSPCAGTIPWTKILRITCTTSLLIKPAP